MEFIIILTFQISADEFTFHAVGSIFILETIPLDAQWVAFWF